MPRRATGEVRCVGGVWTARITLVGRDRPSFAMPWCKTERDATERAQLLADTAQQLRDARSDDGARKYLGEVAAAANERALRIALAALREFAGKEVRPAGAPKAPTFKELGEQWTSGELAKRYPDQIKAK